MKAERCIKRTLAGFLTAMVLLAAGIGFSAVPAKAESGTVYTCAVHGSYAHPVTGVIEDSGGQASYATGQGMVESAIADTGILEVTASGGYYLTIRMSLMDITSNHSFWVQTVGDSGWSSPALGVTGNGTDSNGSTADICIQVPSENCVVRGSMYVQPMGREVIFYLYPSDFAEGNRTDMQATMVTETAAGQEAPAGGAAAVSTPAPEPAATTVPETTPTPVPEETSGTTPAPTGEGEAAATETEPLQNAITQAATPAAEDSGEEDGLEGTQGLSLSTEGEGTAAGAETSAGVSGTRVAELTLSLTLSGLILLAAGSAVVFVFHKNWKRWGEGYEDDEDDEDEA